MFSVWRVLVDRVFTPKNGPAPERRVNGYRRGILEYSPVAPIELRCPATGCFGQGWAIVFRHEMGRRSQRPLYSDSGERATRASFHRYSELGYRPQLLKRLATRHRPWRLCFLFMGWGGVVV